MRVRVHFNLHTHLWSVVALEGERKGRVIAHESHVTLTDCTFKVSETQRQRVIRDKCRSVHAYVVGHWEGGKSNATHAPVGAQRFTYNPYRSGSFHVAGNVSREVKTAARVWFIDKAAYFSN